MTSSYPKITLRTRGGGGGGVWKKFAEGMLIWWVPKGQACKLFQWSCKFFPWCIKVKQFYLKCCWNVATENVFMKYSYKTLCNHCHPTSYPNNSCSIWYSQERQKSYEVLRVQAEWNDFSHAYHFGRWKELMPAKLWFVPTKQFWVNSTSVFWVILCTPPDGKRTDA